MRFLLSKIRKLVFAVNFFVALGIFLYYAITSTSSRILIIRLTQTYALYSVFLLYISLLASPLYTMFPNLRARTLHITARKALGNSAFIFALLHSFIAFFGQLGGFSGLFFLNYNYLLSISLSFTALLILSVMSVTSFSYFIFRLGKHWKPLHRLVYIAATLILIHALILGTHFSNLSGLIPQVCVYALSVLLILEAYRFDKYIGKFHVPRYIVFTVASCAVGLISYQLLFNITDQTFSVHSQHVAGQRAVSGRYTVNMLDAQVIEPNKNVTLRFQIYDNETRKPLHDYAVNYEKLIHMIVVDNSLQYFVHLHPQKTGDEFTITTRFPKSDLYHLYFNYQPIGFQEQVSTINIQVGNTTPSLSNQAPDISLAKTFGAYDVTLKSNGEFQSGAMNQGIELLTFTISDARTKQPVRDLSKYLGAFGHLVMINQQTYDYIHVHPTGLFTRNPDEKGGPDVRFLPLALNTKIVPGIYRIFGQFSHRGTLFVADFTIGIK